NPEALAAGLSTTVLLFTSRELDIETGLYYHRARYLDPTTGRWTSLDPIGFAAGDANLYRYLSNRPTHATDPSGLFWQGFRDWWSRNRVGNRI
ncbi:MAG: RHS repeat-associated core domain-containing protein, partial [Thermogemmata sp.]|nr:RHS repeat-associated core domain-containing protein [Thermogemmata sp.]